MVNVTVVFTNGNVVQFAAQEFDVEFKSGVGDANKYPYKDAEGNDSAIHLRPNDVAGLFVTPGAEWRAGEQAISVLVPRHN
jgi:hypothetical protein